MFDVQPYDRTHLSGILALCIAEGWMSFAADPDRAHRVLTAPGVTTAVAVDGAGGSGEVVGFAQMLSDGEIQAYLANLLVADSRRGQGIARSLLENAHARAGGERVSLLSEEGATGFYAALTHQRKPGFRIYPPFASPPAATAPSETGPPAH
jgi:GNAT superfamily N-acetyltransferase